MVASKCFSKRTLFIFMAAVLAATSSVADDKALFKQLDVERATEIFLRSHQRASGGDENLARLKRAQFATAEYYYQNNVMFDARRSFEGYSTAYPPEVSTLLACVFLMRIAREQGDSARADALRKEIFEKPFIVLFSNYQILKYVSEFGNIYTVRNYIDRIEVFLNGEPFENIIP